MAPIRPRRDMSYRKPVPKYIPSPPPSPPPSSPDPFNRLSFSLSSVMNDDVPPLPSDWREIIDRALGKDNWTQRSIAADAGIGPDHHTSFTCDIYRREQVFSMVEMPGRMAPLASSSLSRKRTLSQPYRPPTPPLPAHYRRRRSPGNDALATVPFALPYQSIYPEPLPSVSLPYSHEVPPMLPSLPASPALPEASLLMANASADAERLLSTNARPFSLSWRLSAATQVYSPSSLGRDRESFLSALPVHYASFVHPDEVYTELADAPSSGLAGRVRALWGRFEVWRRLFAMKLKMAMTVFAH